jgi:hypothetical protein
MDEVEQYQKQISKKRNWKKIVLILLVIGVAAFISLNTLTTHPLIALTAFVVVVFILGLQIVSHRAVVRNLFKEKRQLLKEMQLAEIAYYKRQLLESDYHAIMEKKQQELLSLDAQIEQQLSEKAKTPENTVMKKIAVDKKEELKELLAEKERMQIENKLLIQRFEKRKIDQITYKKLASELRQNNITIAAKIKSLYGEDQIDSVIKQVKQKVKSARREKKNLEEDELMEIATEIVDQQREERERNI